MKVPDDQRDAKKTLYSYYLGVIAIILIMNMVLLPSISKRAVKMTTYNSFLEAVESKTVESVNMTNTEINYVVDDNGTKTFYKTGIVNDPELTKLLKDNNVDFSAEIPEAPNMFMSLLLSYGIPLLIFWFIGKRFMGSMSAKMGANGLNIGGGETAKIYKPDMDKKTFNDVAGQDEAKESLMEIIDYLKTPDKYVEIGAECPKGVLLVGPPGTGKTLLAKAVAGEAEVPFFSISGSEFVEMFVGRGAAKVRELFDQAEKHAPCIVFIDEIDTIGKRRDNTFSTNDEREQTLNQLLTEMDGFEGNKGVIILAATNRPEVLDPALLRPGRFDRHVRVELPDLKGRVEILKVHLRKVKTDGEIDHNFVARMTAGVSGAQVANVVNEAALRAVRFGRKAITTDDLIESIETVIAGQQKKNAILSDEEKMVVSYHEIGHALVAALQTNSAPVEKITIIPRTSGALGYTMQVEQDEKSLYNKEDLTNKIEVLCGGRAAEDVIFGKISTGASNDIEKITNIARQMVTKYGMSETFGMMALETTSSQYLGGDSNLSCSSETSKRIDEETFSIINASYEKAKKMLEDNRDKLNKAAKFLYDRETITGSEFMEVIA